MSLMCKLISKLTITRQLKLERFVIITVKQPSASKKPVIQVEGRVLNGVILFLRVLLLKSRLILLKNLSSKFKNFE